MFNLSTIPGSGQR